MVKPQDIARVQAYLRSTFDNNRLAVKKRANADDSAEIWIGEEFLGVIYRDEDEGEISFPIHITVIEEDLPQL